MLCMRLCICCSFHVFLSLLQVVCILSKLLLLQPEQEQEHSFSGQECFEGGALFTAGLLVACRTQSVYTFGDVCCDDCMRRRRRHTGGNKKVK